MPKNSKKNIKLGVLKSVLVFAGGKLLWSHKKGQERPVKAIKGHKNSQKLVKMIT